MGTISFLRVKTDREWAIGSCRATRRRSMEPALSCAVDLARRCTKMLPPGRAAARVARRALLNIIVGAVVSLLQIWEDDTRTSATQKTGWLDEVDHINYLLRVTQDEKVTSNIAETWSC
jgi:hypothetical protein